MGLSWSWALRLYEDGCFDRDIVKAAGFSSLTNTESLTAFGRLQRSSFDLSSILESEPVKLHDFIEKALDHETLFFLDRSKGNCFKIADECGGVRNIFNPCIESRQHEARGSTRETVPNAIIVQSSLIKC